MELLYEFRDELMKHKIDGFTQFTLKKGGKWIDVNKLIEEIDNLRVCQCPPTENNG